VIASEPSEAQLDVVAVGSVSLPVARSRVSSTSTSWMLRPSARGTSRSSGAELSQHTGAASDRRLVHGVGDASGLGPLPVPSMGTRGVGERQPVDQGDGLVELSAALPGNPCQVGARPSCGIAWRGARRAVR